MASTKAEWVSVKTTLPVRPLPSSSNRPAVTTDRLVVRALVAEDLQGFHLLRTQPEVMANNPRGESTGTCRRRSRSLTCTFPQTTPRLMNSPSASKQRVR